MKKSLIFKILLAIIVTVLSINSLYSQNQTFHEELNIRLERKILNKNSDSHITFRPYNLNDSLFNDSSINIKLKNKFLYRILTNDILNFKREKFGITVNPILKAGATYDKNNKELLSDFRVGLSLKTSYTDKLKLYTNFFVSKVNLPAFQRNFADSFGIMPHFGKYLSKNDNFHSFYSGTGALTYSPGEYLNFEAGLGKHFIGNGYRSLLLSDFSSPYPYFKTSVDIWRIKYIWLVSFLTDNNLFAVNTDYYVHEKYTFTHYLSVNITKRINFDFFETVITNPYDQVGRKGIELSYFNPVIFYRPVEAGAGTYDNSLMGIGLNIRLWKTCYIYSQFILDDMIISEIKANNGWWANKYGFQAGVKSYNLFNIKGLFFLGEINAVRPYTYSHGRDNINYGNRRQALAHPLGANFLEGVSKIQYDFGRLLAKAKIILAKSGADTDSTSHGSDFYKTYALRSGDYNVNFLQGDNTKLKYYELKLSYILNPKLNFMFETGIIHRHKYNSLINEKNTFIFIGLSTSLFHESLDH